jgi:ribosomal protein L21E
MERGFAVHSSQMISKEEKRSGTARLARAVQEFSAGRLVQAWN